MWTDDRSPLAIHCMWVVKGTHESYDVGGKIKQMRHDMMENLLSFAFRRPVC
jgi:hypothetical protein